ncbi:MAG: UDP-N-acetylmuramate dehydrogenase, partial [Rhodococcus sp. (in: high G+C Gram-positive bacteria)]|nr:UDP-N-acetylmuramate dehydrogenase [Rhodococcus sp. (in: high G+C Gram-positive bacteria)]
DDKLPAVLGAITEQLGDVTVPQFPGSGGTKLSAGWLIERAGFSKGYPGEDAPARLSTKHTLALTNRGSATSADVVSLARTVRDGVEAAFGVRLEPEPVTVGCTV